MLDTGQFQITDDSAHKRRMLPRGLILRDRLLLVLLSISVLLIIGALIQLPLIAAAKADKKFDAGGLTNESFTWDYSLYFPTAKSATSNDSDHIKWNGLMGTINYSTAGDRNVTFTFKDSANNVVANGVGRVRVVQKDDIYWKQKPRIDYYTSAAFVKNDFNNGVIDWVATSQASKVLNVDTLVGSYPTSSMEDILDNLSKYSLNFWFDLSATDGINSEYGQYADDFIAWGEYFANLSLKYPNLKAFIIDDWDPQANKKFNFSKENIKRIIQAKNRINPNLKFFPVLYYDERDGLQYFENGNPYKDSFADGASMWYWASYDRLIDLPKLEDYLDDANKYIPPAIIYSGVYPFNTSGTDATFFNSPDDVKKMIEMARKKSDAVGVFYLPLWIPHIDRFLQTATIFKQIANDDNNYSFKLSSNGYTTSLGWYQAVTQTVSLPKTIKTASISFKIKENRDSCTDNINGLYYKQLLVNDKVVWESDICNNGTEALTISEDIKPYLSGTSSPVSIRLYHKKQYEATIDVDVYVGDMKLYINGKLISANWKFDSGIDKTIMRSYQEVFFAAAKAFGSTISCMPGTVSGSKVCKIYGSG